MRDISEAATLIITEALHSSATDIHFHSLDHEVAIHFRVHGERLHHKNLSIKLYEQLLLHFKFSSGMDIGEKNLPQNGTMTFTLPSRRYFLRLSTLPSKPLESLAIRILPQDNELSNHDLFLFPDQYKRMLSLFKNKSGLILFSGKTGSGKTTTMYSLLQTVQSNKSYQTITLENPIEKRIPNILQIEINQNAGLTYNKGLQSVLRHDPDIILIGEILNQELARFAFEAALTGHLVLSTLHAKNATGTIDRLLALGIQKFDLLQSLLAIISLELIPIKIKNNQRRRAAIAEIMDHEHLTQYIKGKYINNHPYYTFHHLRKKAYAYGFLSEKNFF